MRHTSLRHLRWLPILAIGLGGVQARADQSTACPPETKAVALDFKVRAPPPVYNNQLSVQEIRALFGARSQAAVGPYERALGMTYTETTFNLEGSVRSLPHEGGYCVYLDKVAASFGWARMDVYVGREFAPGTCEYRAVVDHENQHVRTDNAVLKANTRRFRAALQGALVVQAPLFTDSRDGAAGILLESIRASMEPHMADFERIMAERNAALDTAESYRETVKLCSHWDGETPPSDSGQSLQPPGG